MSDQAVAIGIDIGGTSAKGGLVTIDGQVHAQASVATADDDALAMVLARYQTLIGDLTGQARALGLRVAGIGVGVPGYLDDLRGAMTYGNVRSLEGFNLRAHLADLFGVPVRLDNDANCAALAEYYWGNGVGCNRLLVVTVGSGIGVGVILEGKLLRYTFGTAGELGSIVVDSRGCNRAFLGGQGGLESVASARAIVEAARSLSPSPGSLLKKGDRHLTATVCRDVHTVGSEPVPLFQPSVSNVADVAELARHDESAAAILRQAGWWLGVGVASWAAIFCPERVLIGGGVAACGDLFLSAVRQATAEMAPEFYGRRLVIETASLGNRAGMMGAGSLILQQPE
jgi:glucokinase